MGAGGSGGLARWGLGGPFGLGGEVLEGEEGGVVTSGPNSGMVFVSSARSGASLGRRVLVIDG